MKMVIITAWNMMDENRPEHHKITRRERMINWLRNERDYKITSYVTICREFCIMRNMQGVLKDLIVTGDVRKLARGYRANKNKA